MLEILTRLGVNVVDADQVAGKVRSSPESRSRIASALHISEGFSDDELRKKLLGDDFARRQLNRILHAETFAWILADSSQVVEIPLLIEAVLHPFFDETWFISAPIEVIEDRLTQRLGSAEAAGQLLSTQLPQEVKSLFCTRVISNNGTLAELQVAVEDAARSCGLFG